ncbi:MAG: hypothetical protein MUO76_01035 [Anaerolineaceae bacterium]|nr:hypothetical protein [Anaerolineaceae bacterium]
MPDWTFLADYSHVSEVKRLKENKRDFIGKGGYPRKTYGIERNKVIR